MSDLLTVNDLHVSFNTPAGPLEAVRGVSFRIKRGSCVAIVGESGSGKSVCAQAIMGILPRNAQITRGQILFASKENETPVDLAQLDLRGEDYRAIRGGQISIIFQEPMTSLSPLHTIGNQISEAVELHENLNAKATRQRCIDILSLVHFPNPERAYKTYPFELSGGLRQRAMIAMALVCSPALLIADEPTTALDVTVQAQILGLIKELQHELNMAVLMITHDMGVVTNVAEEVVVVYQGAVMESGTVEDIFTTPKHDYLKALLQAVPRLDSAPDQRLQPLRAIDPKPGQLLQNYGKDRQTGARAQTILSLQNLTKRFTIRKESFSLKRKPARTVTAVNNVSLDIRRGECLGLVGESGCGKTTLAKMVMGALSTDDGQILFDDGGTQIDLAKFNDKQLIPFRQRIQYIFQDPFGSLNPRMTLLNILSEPLQIHGIGEPAYQRELVMELVDLVGLDPRHLNRYPHSFSGGQRQRIGIARALILQPELLICDEPVSALDVSVQAQVLNLLKDLQKVFDLTYLFISHDLAVVKYLADRIAVMCQGNLVEVAPGAELFRAPRHPYTRALLASVPTPDLNHKLDFALIRDGGATDPKNWPEPYYASREAAARGGKTLRLIDLGGGHFVRAFAVPNLADVS